MNWGEIWKEVASWNWGDIGTWVATTIAAAGAVVSWRKAGEAKEMRDEIAARKAHSELSGLNGILVVTIRTMEKYAPGAGPIARKGSSPSSDAAAVRSLTGEMARLRSILDGKFGKPAITKVLNTLNQLLSDFGDSANDAARLPHGREIYREITVLGGNIKQALDGNLYR